MTKLRTALALAGVLAITATTATSASAQWRGHRGHGWGGWGPGIAAGVATGALVGAAVASRPYGYGGGYYYEEPVYAAPYAYEVAPTYGAPVYGTYGYNRGWGYGQCFTDEGYGRRTPCDASTR